MLLPRPGVLYLLLMFEESGVVEIILEGRRAFDLRKKAADVIGKARSTKDAFFFSGFFSC
jgi:hypothetical protein